MQSTQFNSPTELEAPRKSAFERVGETVKSCIRIRRTTPLSIIDVLSAVSVLGVIAATVFWAVV